MKTINEKVSPNLQNLSLTHSSKIKIQTKKPNMSSNQFPKTVETLPKPMDHLKFQLKKDNENYLIHHPSPVTRGADLLLELTAEGPKNWLIPVDKEFLVSKVPFFKALFNSEGFWKETENVSQIEGVPRITVQKLDNISNETMFKFLEMLYARSIYDENDSKFNSNNYVTSENVLQFIELSQFWMVEDMKKEAIKYADKNMDAIIVMNAFKYNNPFVREIVEPICQLFIQLTEAGTRESRRLENICDNAEARMKKVDLKLRSVMKDLNATKIADYDEDEFIELTDKVRNTIDEISVEVNKPNDERPTKRVKHDAEFRHENLFQYGKRKYSNQYSILN